MTLDDRGPQGPYTFLEDAHLGRRVGIACSGGGIRSASFNLGALQASRELGALKRTRYLTAVSGGNYIASAHLITASCSPEPGDTDEPFWSPLSPECRRLRSHSDYLAPGVSGKLWLALTYVYGLVMSLTPMLAVAVALGTSYGFLAPPEIRAALRSSGGAGIIVWPHWLSPMVAALLALALVSAASRARYRPSGVSGAAKWAVPVGTCALTGVAALLAFTVAIPVMVIGARLAFRAISAGITSLLGRPSSSLLVATSQQRSMLAVVIILLAGAVPAFVVVRLARRRKAQRLMLVLAALAGPHIALLPFIGAAHRSLAGGFMWSDDGAVILVSIAVAAAFSVVFHNGQSSLHRLYRERLSSVFAVKRADADTAGPVNYGQPLYLSKMSAPADFPELIVCAALNVTDRSAPRGRNSASFTFSRSTSGSPLLGQFPTNQIENLRGLRGSDLTIPALMAISGAALSPVMGRLTVRPLRILLALLNVRLGVWIPSPARFEEWDRRESTRISSDALRQETSVPLSETAARYPGAGPLTRLWRALADGWREPGAMYLLSEAVGYMSPRSRFLYITDGGHWENLGLVELLRRRCSDIICFDATYDPSDRFESLAIAIALAETELGVRVEIDPRPLARRPTGDGLMMAEHDVVVGRVIYPDQPPGRLVYARATISEKTPPHLALLANSIRRFPDHPTGNQFFRERELEGFRSLGHSTALRAWAALSLPPLGSPPESPTLGRMH